LLVIKADPNQERCLHAMKFWMQQPGGCMCIDNAVINGIPFPGLPRNVFMVFWDNGRGEVEYYDALSIRTPFTDLTPYLPYVDNFLTAAQHEEQPLNLRQAKAIKNEIIDTLFNCKRQLPVAFDGQDWDGIDESVNGLVRQLIIGSPDAARLMAVVRGIETRRTTLHNARLQKRAAIDALTDVPAVIAFNPVSDW
jgi:hypothetical protein